MISSYPERGARMDVLYHAEFGSIRPGLFVGENRDRELQEIRDEGPQPAIQNGPRDANLAPSESSAI